MRIAALALSLVTLVLCFEMPADSAKTAVHSPAQSGQSGPVTTDVDDSELFFQNALRARGPQRDNSQKIEALLKRMTLENVLARREDWVHSGNSD
jgi:hypothetical protein